MAVNMARTYDRFASPAGAGVFGGADGIVLKPTGRRERDASQDRVVNAGFPGLKAGWVFHP
jgi:hypothetical protein